jgi:Trypsin-like peptidase domain
MRVRFGGGLYDVADVRVWSENGEHDRRGIDVATLTLTRAARGHVFKIAPTGAPTGSHVATIGYPLGRLKVARGTLTNNLIDYGKPMLAAKFEGPPEGGNSGGPIINDAGEVLSVFSRAVITANLTRDRRHRLGGIDLPRWWRDDAYPDLCRAHPDGGIPDCDLSSTSRPGKVPVVLPPPR